MLMHPDYPTPRPASHNYTRNVTIGVVDWNGTTKSARISGIDATVTQAEVDAMREAMGALTNGGIYRDALEDDTNMSIIDAVTHIDPFAEVSDVGVFRFDHPNNDVKSIYVEVPAIYANYVNTGTNIIDIDDPVVGAFVTATLAVLNKVLVLGDSYFLAKAYYSDRKGSKTSPNAIRPASRDPRAPIE